MAKGTVSSLITEYYLPREPTGILTRLMKKHSVQNGGWGGGGSSSNLFDAGELYSWSDQRTD